MNRPSLSFDWQTGLVLIAISTNHFMQRPLRDTMAVLCEPNNLNWLMSGTLIGTLVLSIVLIYLEKTRNITAVIPYLLTAVAMVQLVMYQTLQHPTFHGAMFYFAFNGATSLTLLSLVFRRVLSPNANCSNQLLNGYTASNIGAIAGPIVTLGITYIFDELIVLPLSSFLLICVAFAIISTNQREATLPVAYVRSTGNFPIKRFIIFMLLYTFIATCFYFFLLKSVSITMPPIKRVQFFSVIDIVTNGVVLFLPYLLQRWNRKPIAFLIVPGVSLLLLSTLGLKFTLVTAALALMVFKMCNLSLQRPARELFLLQASFAAPYGTKNFLDTAIYRLGDVLAAWVITMMLTTGLELKYIALCMLPITILWIIMGNIVSKNIKLTTT